MWHLFCFCSAQSWARCCVRSRAERWGCLRKPLPRLGLRGVGVLSCADRARRLAQAGRFRLHRVLERSGSSHVSRDTRTTAETRVPLSGVCVGVGRLPACRGRGAWLGPPGKVRGHGTASLEARCGLPGARRDLQLRNPCFACRDFLN